MPVVETGRKHLSDLVAATGTLEEMQGVDFYYARVEVVEGAAGGEVIDPIGTQLVYSAGASAFIPYVDTDLSTVTTSSLPNNAPICVSAGAKEGKGFNKTDITLSATPVEMVVLFRGEAVVNTEGMDVQAGSGAPEQAAFIEQLELQNVAVRNVAEDVDPSYVSYP